MRPISHAFASLAVALGLSSISATDFATAMRRDPIHDLRAARSRRLKTTFFNERCGKRQQARYARQMAAGQIKFIEHGPRQIVVEAAPKKPRVRKAAPKKVMTV